MNKDSTKVGIYWATYLQCGWKLKEFKGCHLLSALWFYFTSRLPSQGAGCQAWTSYSKLSRKKSNTFPRFSRGKQKSWNYKSLFASWVINSSLTDHSDWTDVLIDQAESDHSYSQQWNRPTPNQSNQGEKEWVSKSNFKCCVWKSGEW